MTLAVGARIGPYEVTGTLGAGGMGEVYRARDTRLGRDVALKVVPESFSVDPDRQARFAREAQVLAALNHPNIAAVYGLEEMLAETGTSVGSSALVMELVAGDTLADRIARGPIALDEAMAVARQVAAALDAAHTRGIVHRDLKPANIKVSLTGTVKVLDFGLAKVTGEGGAVSGSLASMATVTSPAMMTGAGIILGTAAYMSPEQARGLDVDKRADIWAFGVIVYEMITGRRPFTGATMTDVLASIVREEPELGTLPNEVRPLVRACLVKDPDRRLRDIGDLELLSAGAHAAKTPVKRAWLPWAITGAAVAASIVAVGLSQTRSIPPAAPPTRLAIRLPVTLTTGGAFAISPDGGLVAFHAPDANGRTVVWLRRLDTGDTRVLPGTDVPNVSPMWWSPDSRFLAFASLGTLKKIDVAAGAPETVCEVKNAIVGGTWNQDGVIVFGQSGGPLMRVSANGGEAMPLTALGSGERQHAHPVFLSDERRLLYRRVSAPERSGVYLGALDVAPDAQSAALVRATDASASFAVAPDGRAYLFYLRGQALVAHEFDEAAGALQGEGVVIADPVGVFLDRQQVAVSANGPLIYRAGERQSGRLGWLAPGKPFEPVGDQGIGLIEQVKLSPDATRAAVIDGGDVWVIDLTRGVRSRLTATPGRESNPIWSPTGEKITFRAQPGTLAATSIHEIAADGSGESREIKGVLGDGTLEATPRSWSNDGRFLFFTSRQQGSSVDVWAYSPADGRRTRLLASPFRETSPTLSPNGRWLAYLANDSGRDEVYVRAFQVNAGGEPSVGARWTVSNGGAVSAMWRTDGKALIYGVLGVPSKTLVVDVADSGAFKTGSPRRHMEFPGGPVGGGDLHPDGSRALISLAAEGATASDEFSAILNWRALLPQ
jgi:Tol biopolymer transport system component